MRAIPWFRMHVDAMPRFEETQKCQTKTEPWAEWVPRVECEPVACRSKSCREDHILHHVFCPLPIPSSMTKGLLFQVGGRAIRAPSLAPLAGSTWPKVLM